jgi:ribosomal protein L11 methyltransferase
MMVALVVDVDADEVELASDALWSLGVVAIEERVGAIGRVELWTSLGDDRDAVRSAVSSFPATWITRTVDVDEAVADTWRQHATPTFVDDDLVICPAWLDEDFADAMTVIRIEPGATFGLGDHPTTMMTMRALRRELAARRNASVLDAPVLDASVLDVGCGSGVLAVAAIRFGATRAVGIDISPAAVQVTLANAKRNDVLDAVTAATTPLDRIEGTYDIVLANILGPALIELAADLVRVVGDGGVLVISGILADRYADVLDALRPLRVDHVDELNGWVAVTLRR